MASGNKKKRWILFCFDGDRLSILKKKDPTALRKKSIHAASRCIFYLFAQSMSEKACLPVAASQPLIGYNGST